MPLSNATVLVVDDDSEIRFLVRSVLDRAGYHVLEAGDGDAAVAMAATGRPDLILLDISMPGRDGISVATEICSRSGPRPLLIALSGRHLPSEREHALAAGCDLFLPKPCPPSRLLETVAELLASRVPTAIAS
ncbi:MAG: response regulator [Deltaproteobacteria bacterium]